MEKHIRVLSIYEELSTGRTLQKSELAVKYGVTERTVQRDIDDLRTYLAEKLGEASPREIIFDRKEGGFRLVEQSSDFLTAGEALVIGKILLESRSLPQAEINAILEKVVRSSVAQRERKEIESLLSNERRYYIPPRHGRRLTDTIWKLGQAIREQRFLLLRYSRTKDKKVVERRVRPVGLLFSEFYFYLCAFLEDVDRETEFENKDDISPTIYRVDRIEGFRTLEEKFEVPYKDRFQEGEFRKRVQFMYGGKLQRIRFRYFGPDVTTVLDRLPTAIIEREDHGPPHSYTLRAEVFGKGIEMWLRSQGEYVEICLEKEEKICQLENQ